MRALNLISIFLLFLHWTPASAEVTIVHTEPVIERRTFDPRNPPPDLPKMTGQEAAKTVSYFHVQTGVRSATIDRRQVGNSWQATSRIDSIRMTLKLNVTVWLPQNPPPKIVDHEEGHRRIAEHFYEDAEKIARSLADRVIGQTVVGSGGDVNAAADSSVNEVIRKLGEQYLDQTDRIGGKAQEEFDRITAYGTNAVPVDRAMQSAIERATAVPSTQPARGR